MTKYNLPERDVLSVAYIGIRLGHEEINEDMKKYVTGIEYNFELNEIPEGKIHINDIDGVWHNHPLIKKKTEIYIRFGMTGVHYTPIRGKIELITSDFSEGSSTMEITIFALSENTIHLKYTQTYKDMTVSGLIKKLWEQAGLEITVDDTETVFETLVLNFESAYEFAERWRKKLGWVFYKTDKGRWLFVKEVTKENSKVRELTYPMDLLKFTPTITEMEDEEDDEDNEESEEMDNKGRFHATRFNKVHNQPIQNSTGRKGKV